MSVKYQRAREWLRKRQRKPKCEFPMATMVCYGPDDQRASKLSVAIIEGDGENPSVLERWFSEDSDIRYDDRVIVDVVACLKAHAVQRVVAVDRLLGCPHEEGIDYPEGETCPHCPFWGGRDRFSGELLDDSDRVSVCDDDNSENTQIIYSSHCQRVEQDGVSLDVSIYRGSVGGWLLEVVNENNTSFVWDDTFDSDDEAWEVFRQTVRDEGIATLAKG